MYLSTKNIENIISGHISKYVESGGVASLVMQCGVNNRILIDQKNKKLSFVSTGNIKTMRFAEIGNISTRFTKTQVHGATDFWHCAIDFHLNGSDTVEMSIPFAKEKAQMDGVFETVKTEIRR